MKPPCISLRLEESENVTLSDCSLRVPHDETVLVIQELKAHLGNLPPRTCAAHNSLRLDQTKLLFSSQPLQLYNISVLQHLTTSLVSHIQKNSSFGVPYEKTTPSVSCKAPNTEQDQRNLSKCYSLKQLIISKGANGILLYN